VRDQAPDDVAVAFPRDFPSSNTSTDAPDTEDPATTTVPVEFQL
jgi:hypothetical protein